MQNQLFEAALGLAKPWYVGGIDFDAAKRHDGNLKPDSHV